MILYPARDGGEDPRCGGPDLRVLGMPDQGTFAEYICVPADAVVDKPVAWGQIRAKVAPSLATTRGDPPRKPSTMQPAATYTQPGPWLRVTETRLSCCKEMVSRRGLEPQTRRLRVRSLPVHGCPHLFIPSGLWVSPVHSVLE